MKLKHPAVLSLTSICHCKLGRKKGRETDGKKDKEKTMVQKTRWGRSFLILVDGRDVRIERNEGEVTVEDQRINGDRGREETH